MLQTKASPSRVAALVVTQVPSVPAFALPDPRLNAFLLGSFRGLPRMDWVFQPEVSLGAALRVHAPPARV